MRGDSRRPSELVSASGAAELLGVTPSAVSNYRARTRRGRLTPPFPEAWVELRRGGNVAPVVLFVREEVEAFGAARAAIVAERDARNVARLERELSKARARVATQGGGRTRAAV